MTLDTLLGVLVLLGGTEGLEHMCSDSQPSAGISHNNRPCGTKGVWGIPCKGSTLEENEDQKA